jgi:dTDP-4-dehydrorhamnose 3,5-epimerase
MIAGVMVKSLTTHADERGFFREIIRSTDEFFREGFAQWSHSLMYAGVIKAWHIHPTQIDWWYVPLGNLKVVLFDKRPTSPTAGSLQTIFLGDNYPAQVIKIPAGVAHGCKALSGMTHLFYVTSKTYDPKEEGRIAHDDKTIAYDWTAGPEIK